MHSISDLTTFARKTKGDVPPPVVGASTTVIGNKMYLYGGRLVSQRKMTSDLYVFDLQTFVWTKHTHAEGEDIPSPRYFHSADPWNNHLIVFGGMGAVSPGSEDLCVLSDVRFFSLETLKWVPPTSSLSTDPDFIPRARYAHLSSVTAGKLFIIGGQDMTNVWLDDIHVFDLVKKEWTERREYPRHCGTYRSVAVSGEMIVRSPMQELKAGTLKGNEAVLGPAGQRFAVDGQQPSSPSGAISDSLVHLAYSAYPTAEHPNDIHIYSNYNFTDVKRELEVISPDQTSFSITDRSSAMTGFSLPPGLRFPTGAIIGTHLIIAGTYLAHSYQSFSIWALELRSMTWTRIEPGATLSTGSWSRGVLWANKAKFIAFGNREGNLVEDYNRRLLNWDHVAYIDLEAFGIYQPPQPSLDITTQELGLAALEEELLADFELVCDDGRKIKCSRKLLEERWPWFKVQRKRYLEAATKALEAIPATSYDTPLTPSPTPTSSAASSDEAEPRPDPRLTPRQFNLSEPYPITLAFLQYLYTLALLTPLQHAPPVLSALLLLSATYELPHLESLVKHAMHGALSPANSVGLYEVATLCDCQSLQIRALRVVMSSSKRPAQRFPRQDNRPNGANDDGGPGGRPRGMSDGLSRGRSNTTADSLAASSMSSGRTVNGNVTPVQRQYVSQQTVQNGASVTRSAFTGGAMDDLYEDDEEGEDRGTEGGHGQMNGRAQFSGYDSGVSDNLEFGDALARTHQLALSSFSPMADYDDPMPPPRQPQQSQNLNGRPQTRDRDTYAPNTGPLASPSDSEADVMNNRRLSPKVSFNVQTQAPLRQPTSDQEYETMSFARSDHSSLTTATSFSLGTSSSGNYRDNGSRTFTDISDVPSQYSSGSSSRHRSYSDTNSRTSQRPASPPNVSSSNHNRSDSIATPTEQSAIAMQMGHQDGHKSNGTLSSRDSNSITSKSLSPVSSNSANDRSFNIAIGPVQGGLMSSADIAAARASLGLSGPAAPVVSVADVLRAEKEKKAREKEMKAAKGSTFSWRPSKSEEKKRKKEMEQANIERLAAEAKLRAKKITTSTRTATLASVDTPASKDWASMGGV